MPLIAGGSRDDRDTIETRNSATSRGQFMENSLTIALARQSVLARQMDVIATNLANLETAGFKSEHMIFTELIEQTSDEEFLSIVIL